MHTRPPTVLQGGRINLPRPSPPLPYHILKGFYPLHIVCYAVYKMMAILWDTYANAAAGDSDVIQHGRCILIFHLSTIFLFGLSEEQYLSNLTGK